MKDVTKFVITVSLHLSGDPQAHVARVTHMKKLLKRIEAIFTEN